MLRQTITFEVNIEDEDEVLSALRTYQEATGTDLVSSLLDHLHDSVAADDVVEGTVYLCDDDDGNPYWSPDTEDATIGETVVVVWKWNDTVADWTQEP
jgi:hypothetical protein